MKGGWKYKNIPTIVGNEKNPTKMESGQVIINKKATKKNLNKLIEINEDSSKSTDKKVTTDGTSGGILKGKAHYDKDGNPLGGIPVIVDGSKKIEVEGDEFVVNKEASQKHWKELSKINQSAGNGVPIKPNDLGIDEDPEEFKQGGVIQFNPNDLPSSWVYSYAKKVKEKYPKVWDLGGNIFGNEAFKNLERVIKRGYWTQNEEWMYIKWRSYVARHKQDFRIAGVIAMLKWVDKVDKGWPYMKELIQEEIEKRYPKKKKGGVVTYKKKYNKKYGYKENESHDLEEIAKDTGISEKGIQKIYNKGIGAYKTNPSSVRPEVKSKEQWGMGRVYSAVMAGKAARIDANELKMENGGTTGEIFERIVYFVTADTNDFSSEIYIGDDYKKALSKFESADISDVGSDYGGTVSLQKKTYKYKFVGDLEDGEYDISDFPIDDFYNDADYYELIEEGETEYIDSKDVSYVNEKSDDLLYEIKKHYGNSKYTNMVVDNGKKSSEPDYKEYGCIQLRITDHSENVKNIDKFGNCDYYISVVVADKDKTKGRFLQSIYERKSNEVELRFDSNQDFNDILSEIESSIDEAKEYIIGKFKMRNGGSIENNACVEELVNLINSRSKIKHWIVDKNTNNLVIVFEKEIENYDIDIYNMFLNELTECENVFDKEVEIQYDNSDYKTIFVKLKTSKENNGAKNIEFMKWFVDWYKTINKQMNINFSAPNILAPFKEDNVIILDLFEKINQDIDAKPYLNKIIEKADKFGVVIYLEPTPRHKYFLGNSEKRKKISRDYLIKYYKNFGFELTPNGQFMKRLPKMKNGGELAKGIKTEQEHKKTLEKIASGEITVNQAIEMTAKDHLKENPKYYTELAKIEKHELGGDLSSYSLKTPTGEKSRLTYLQQVLVRTEKFKEFFGDWETAARSYLLDGQENFENHYKNVSKVLDMVTLEPRVVYHGTRSDSEFFTFDVSMEKGQGRPYAYFAHNKEYSKNFTDFSQRNHSESNPYLYECFLNIRNPFMAVGHQYEFKSRDYDSWIKIITGTIAWDKYQTIEVTEETKKLERAIRLQVEDYMSSLPEEKVQFWKFMARDIKSLFKFFLISYGYDGIFYGEEIASDYDPENERQYTRAVTVFSAKDIKLADGRNLNFNPMETDIRYKDGGSVDKPEIKMSKKDKLGSLLFGEKYEKGGFISDSQLYMSIDKPMEESRLFVDELNKKMKE